MAEKQCNKCGKRGLIWDKDFHKVTGKWKLESHRRADGKWCNKPPEKIMPTRKREIVLCELCDGTSFGMCRSREDYYQHKKIYHPNNERMTELDWRMKMTPREKPHTNWSSDPHYARYVNVGKK